MNTFVVCLKYGSVAGTLTLFYVQLLTKVGTYYDEPFIFYFGYLGILIMPIFTFLAIRKLSLQYEPYIPFLHALFAGLLVSIIAGLAYSAFNWIEHQLFPDHYVDHLIEKTKEEMVNAGQSTAEIKERVQRIYDHYNSWRPFFNTMIWYTGLGILYTSLSYFILKFIHYKKK
jgi:hypothetical protein